MWKLPEHVLNYCYDISFIRNWKFYNGMIKFWYIWGWKCLLECIILWIWETSFQENCENTEKKRAKKTKRKNTLHFLTSNYTFSVSSRIDSVPAREAGRGHHKCCPPTNRTLIRHQRTTWAGLRLDTGLAGF